MWRGRYLGRCLAVTLVLSAGAPASVAQVENVPVANQVYDFLDRLGVRGVLPLYSNRVLPLSREEVCALLSQAASRSHEMTEAELRWLAKFQREFEPDAQRAAEESYRVFGAHEDAGAFFSGAVSDREKYLFAIADSSVTVFGEFLASLDYRHISGDTRGSTDATLGTIGGRFRGTALGTLGYYLQATNGELWGDRSFAMADKKLAANFKFSEEGKPYFDFTEAYLRLRLSWFHVKFGREAVRVGLGYGDRLILGESAPVMDLLELGARYGSFRFTFLHGVLRPDSVTLSGIPDQAPEDATKYFVLHRFQFSLFDVMNLGLGEMVIYQRLTPEYAYLNPVNFYKSAEHSLGDKDNALLVLDAEVFPLAGYKLYGTWLIDDIDFAKMGTGWWANQFGWNAGMVAAGVAGIADVDLVAEYARLEPYLYSNRLADNDYTHNSVSLGHRLDPNSDEMLLELRYRPTERLRCSVGYLHQRHGANVVEGDSVLRNVGGSALQGHRDTDAQHVTFLDGVRQTANRYQARADYEPVTNLILSVAAEYRRTWNGSVAADDRLLQLSVHLEY